MKLYEKEQKVIQIKNVKIGGQPGANPPVMIGTLFYAGHKAVTDPKNGIFNKEEVLQEVNTMIEWGQKTSLPIIFDLVGESAEALESYARFISEAAPNIPFLVDGLSDVSRVPAMQKIKEMGLLDSAILNSIDFETKDEAIQSFKDSGVKNAVLLTFEKLSLTPDKKVRLLNGIPGKMKGLLQKAEEAGIKNTIVDAAVLDLASVAMCAASCDKIKTEFGLPVGCAPPNAVFEWKKGKEDFGKEARVACEAAMNIFIRDFGADFILFGPAKYAPQMFAPMALHSAITSYYQKRINKLDVNPDVMGKCF